ncbi:MAG: hypothetical protein QM767_13050 [Anaeromyxobacter sp.]
MTAPPGPRNARAPWSQPRPRLPAAPARRRTRLRLPAPTVSSCARLLLWRTRLELSPAERDALEKLHATRLYVRFFDVE